MSSTILTIEDDNAIRRGIVDALTHSGYRVLEAANGKLGLELAKSASFDLLLLDLVLPDLSGLEILRDIRRHDSNQSVIILTAMGQEEDRVQGLKLGADDYVVKPFSVRELIARVEAVLRRAIPRIENLEQIVLPGATVDIARRTMSTENGQSVSLSELETQLIRYLAAQGGHPISREELLKGVWGINPRGVETRTVDMQVARVREKLTRLGIDSGILKTVRGEGYLLKVSEPSQGAMPTTSNLAEGS
ncbi:MAG: response regulator transcription factor [Pirellulaceae bacterium]